MATVRPSGAGDEAVGTGERKNGGTVLHGGSNSAGIFTKNLSLADVANDVGESFGSKVVANDGAGSQFTDRAGVAKAVSGGTLAYKADATEWVMKGGNVSVTLGGVANTTLVGGAAGPDPTRDSTNQLETTRDYGSMVVNPLAAPASGINSFRTITGGGSEVAFVRPSGAGDEASNDKAANTTRSLPGQLVYRFGGASAQLDSYKSKESPES